METHKRPSNSEPLGPQKRLRNDSPSEFDDQLDSVADIPLIDSRQLQIMLINLQRRIAENIDLRLKYHDEPIKFMESEEALHETVKLFEGIAPDSERTDELLESPVRHKQAAKDLVMLLSHDNCDIAAQVSKVWYEIVEESSTAALKLYELGAFFALHANLRRMDERDDEEFQGVYYTLGLLEAIVEKGGFEGKEGEAEVLDWLLVKLQDPEFSTNQLYSSEILSSMLLLPAIKAEAKRYYTAERLLFILQRLVDVCPDAEDERELYENIMNCLAISLLDAEGREAFRVNDGIELALTLLK